MEKLLSPELGVFGALGLITIALLIIEMVMMFTGLSEGSSGAPDAPEVGGFDIQPAPHDLSVLTSAEIALLDVPAPDKHEELRPKHKGIVQMLSMIGIGNGPLVIALAVITALISSFGFLLQGVFDMIFGAMAPAGMVMIIVIVPALVSAGKVTRWLSRLIPSLENSSIPSQTFNGRRGIVLHGQAERGKAAPVRWEDSYGNTHTTLSEPLRETDKIPENTPVLIVRTKDRQPRIVALTQ